MLSDAEFEQWCRCLKLSAQSREKIQHVRSSEPYRRVGGGKKNVSGRYPSRKMGRTIQFESHRNELAHIYKLEYDSDVLEYYDQPPPIELNYFSKSGRAVRVLHTPDFFVMRRNSAGWEECKTELDLLALARESPNRFQQGDSSKWHCPPGEQNATFFGLYYAIRSDVEINSTLLRNLIWLEGYFHNKRLEVNQVVTGAVRALVAEQPGITLAELIEQVEAASIDELHVLIATNQLYVDLEAAPLSHPQQVAVFLDAVAAYADAQLTRSGVSSPAERTSALQARSGTSICWDGQVWEILNTGANCVSMLGANGQYQDLPNSVFEALVGEGKITGLLPKDSTVNTQVETLLHQASYRDRAIAAQRYRQIEAFLNNTASTKTNRSQRRWIASFLKAEKAYGRGFVGLLPQHQHKGNRLPKMMEDVRMLMTQQIEQEYENLKQPSIRQAYRCFKQLCEQQQLQPPSFEIYRLAVRNRPLYEQIKQRLGDRAAYKQEPPFHWFLDREAAPPHGERPFELCHIDHTQADVELLSSIMLALGMEPDAVKQKANLGRPWVSLLTDAYSRRVLAVYMTFDPPSYRSDMMVLRICVQRYGRLPQIIVMDGGKDFDSIDFEVLMAYFCITKKQRPPAKSRFGSVIESFFGVADKEFWHNLIGHTLIMRRVRQVTQGVNPKHHAVWTLGKLYAYFCEYCYEVYDTCPHPALRISPREAFHIGMARSGSRDHLLLSVQEVKLLALPTPKDRGRTRKIVGDGIKIHYLFYRNSLLSQSRSTRVEVKYDPFDITVAYAYVNGQWVQCRCGYLQELEGHSQRELMIAAAELKKLNRLQNHQFIQITDQKLAQFFTRLKQEETALTPQERQAKKAVQTQHLRDAELVQVHAQIEGNHLEPHQEKFSSADAGIAAEAEPAQIAVDEQDEIFHPLEEW